MGLLGTYGVYCAPVLAGAPGFVACDSLSSPRPCDELAGHILSPDGTAGFKRAQRVTQSHPAGGWWSEDLNEAPFQSLCLVCHAHLPPHGS